MNNSEKAICPICNSTKCKQLSVPAIYPQFKSFIRKDYKTYYCMNCNYYFVYPAIDLTSEEWSNMYSDGYFDDSMTKWWGNKRAKERARVISLFKSNSSADAKNFLEIGCGEGYTLIDAHKMNWNVNGIDVYDNRKVRDKNTCFEIGDLLERKYRSGGFDYVYMDSVLEHVSDPVKYINEINRILADGGVLYLAVPNENALIFKFRNLVFKLSGNKVKSTSFQPFQHPYHINGFTKKSLERLLHDSGFTVIKYRNYAGWYEFLKYRFLSKGFIKNLLLLPVHIAAIVFRMEYYQDAVCKKNSGRP